MAEVVQAMAWYGLCAGGFILLWGVVFALVDQVHLVLQRAKSPAPTMSPSQFALNHVAELKRPISPTEPAPAPVAPPTPRPLLPPQESEKTPPSREESYCDLIVMAIKNQHKQESHDLIELYFKTPPQTEAVA